jgi:hypothetical protein
VQFGIYQSTDNQIQIQVRFDEETVWLSKQQIAILFNQTKQNISLHINNFLQGRGAKPGFNCQGILDSSNVRIQKREEEY